jgi:nucleoside-diphosphate-sugar epimerase
MKVLVTGGQGFIGRHVSLNLLMRGYEVLTLDRKSGNHTLHVPEKGRPLCTRQFIADIKDREAVFDAVNQTDCWINLAGLLGTSELIHNATEAVAVNVQGAINVFDAAAQYGKRGVQITVGNHWMNNPYSITKSTAERLALMYNKELGTDIRVVRGMNVYGPGQKHRPVRKFLPNVIIPALLGKPITVYGDGEQVMDVIYVKDVAEILARLLLKDRLNNSEVYEAGTGSNQTINQILTRILSLADSQSEIQRVSMRPGEHERAIVRAGKWPALTDATGYEWGDLTPQSEAFQQTIDWYRERLDQLEWDG